MRRTVIVLVVGVLCAGGLQAQERNAATSSWAAGSGGAIPDGAIAYGREADGREQFVCRGAHGGGTHLGKITAGFSGCNIGYGGREITLGEYEVLVRPRTRRADIAADAVLALLESRAGDRGRRDAGATPSPAPAPAPAAAAETERGFDENGEPYVIVRFPDGTVERRTPKGGVRTKPDGTQEKIPQLAYAHAPIGTPPELPADPKQGRKWMENHNGALLSMIQALVKNEQAEMKKFDDSERRANVADIYEQIAYRTEVARFLAQGR